MKIDAEITDVIVDSTEKSCLPPIIVNFQNGQLKDDETNNMKSGIFSETESGKTVLALSNGKIVYKGYRPDTDKEPMCTMFAVYNKKSGKVRLIQAERWDVAPVINRNVVSSHNLETDKIATLNKEFGSKKAKRKTELREKMKITGESVKELLERTVSNVEIEKEDDTEPEDLIISTILPPCNREATELTNVYDINDIVPKAVLKTLHHVELETIENDLKGKSEFFTKTFEIIKQLPSPSKRLAALLYIDAVTNWFKVPIKDARRRIKGICPFSTEVNDYIIEKYSMSSIGGRARPNIMKDKGVIHCMVLSLAICDYSLDLELFAQEIGFRISLKRLTEFARLLCATPSKNDKKVVCLKLPLPPPITSFNRRPRK